MTTGGFHLLSGLIIASFIRDEKYKKAKWGIVWGSIFPDIDLIASIIIYLLTRDFNSAVFIHRSITHGFFAVGLVVVIGFIISRTRQDFNWVFLFSLAFGFGMLTHILYDLLDWYVAIFAPFSYTRYSITGITDPNLLVGGTFFKVWNAFDAMSDVIFYLLLWYWATRKANITNELKFAKKLLILSYISVAYFGFLIVLAFTDISVEMHYILIFALWGTIYLPLSTIYVHIKMRETIQDFSFLEIRKS